METLKTNIMKQYKLIKKLPFDNSPDIGYISKEKAGQNGAHYWNHSWFYPENYPEFWELVEEEDDSYQILDWANDRIYKIKRTSNGEVFTVGDVVVHKYTCKEAVIEYFHVMSNGIWFKTSRYDVPLTLILGRVKTYLFTTYDGVKIYEGMYSTAVCNKTLVIEYTGELRGDSSETFLYFSTPQAAQEYIDENTKKPILRTEDNVDLYEGDTYWYVDIEDWNIKECYVYADTEKYSGFKDFSTKQAAQDYVNLHKPKFSKQEIHNVLNNLGKIHGGAVYEYVLKAFNCKDE